MKTLMVLIFTIGLAFGAEAQAKINRGGAVRSFSPRTTVVAVAPVVPFRMGFGMGYGYGYRFSPFYSPFYDPFYAYPRYESTPSALQLELDDIKNEFSHKLSTARNDKSISKQERRQRVRDLKHQREDAIIDAKKRFYKRDGNSSN